jgi:hypothetical protein
MISADGVTGRSHAFTGISIDQQVQSTCALHLLDMKG